MLEPKKYQVYCLICDKNVGDPQELEKEYDPMLLLGIINKNYFCPRCMHLTEYGNTFIKLGIREVDEKTQN